jgi:membrane protease YdiL (CAAX protease family)
MIGQALFHLVWWPVQQFDKKGVKTMIAGIDRKRIFVFVAITYGITIAVLLAVFLEGGLGPDSTLAGLLGFMIVFAPALGNIATRLITREGWSNTFLRPNLRHGWRLYLAACILPLVAIFLGGAIYFLLFPGKLDLSMGLARETGKISATDTLATVMGRELLGGLVTVLYYTFLVWGEEFGWRAYLLPKLMPLGARKAVLLVGVVWGMWHWPMIYFMGFQYGSDYWGAPVSGFLLFVLIILSPSVVYSWLTLRTGSVWPACIAHAVHNTFCSLMLYFVRGEPNHLIGPEPEAIVGCLGYVLLALLILFSPRAFAQPVPAQTDAASSKNLGAAEQAAGRAKLGTAR